jgi:hypothetical protein
MIVPWPATAIANTQDRAIPDTSSHGIHDSTFRTLRVKDVYRMARSHDVHTVDARRDDCLLCKQPKVILTQRMTRFKRNLMGSIRLVCAQCDSRLSAQTRCYRFERLGRSSIAIWCVIITERCDLKTVVVADGHARP